MTKGRIKYKDFKHSLSAQEFDFDRKPDLDEKEAARLANAGMNMAVEHAEKESPGWAGRAYRLFVDRFLLNTNGTFMAEDFRSYCAEIDFELPPHSRAFGGVMVKALHNGVIKKAGTANTRSKKSHRTPATLWIQVKPSERK